MKDWRKEIARDFLALGSWVFFLLVIGRILVLPYKWPFLYHLIIGGVVILVLELVVSRKIEIDYYISRALVLAYFTTIFYENETYGIFVKVVFAGLVLSSKYVGNSWRKIIYGLILGGGVVGLSYLVSGIV